MEESQLYGSFRKPTDDDALEKHVYIEVEET